MSSHDVASGAGHGDSWQAVEALVDEVAILSRSELAADDFHQVLLGRAVEALAAVAAVLWTARGKQPLCLEAHLGLEGLDLPSDAEPDWQQQLAETARSTGKTLRLPPGATAAVPMSPRNPTSWELLCCPFSVEARMFGVLVVFQRPGGAADTQQGYLHAAAALAELAADFHARMQLRQLGQREALWQRFETWINCVYRTLDLRSLSLEIVNEGRRLIECDRLSLALRHEGKCRLEAMSAIDRFDPRSSAVQGLENLASRAAIGGASQWLSDSAQPADPKTAEVLEQYLRLSSAREVGLVPLEPETASGQCAECLGVLIVERFKGPPTDAGGRERAEVVARHSAVALGHALELQRIPLRRALAWLGPRRTAGAKRRARKWLLAAAGLAAVVVALVFVPADFEIEARGTLEPSQRRDVFATADGIVDKIEVRHGDQVAEGALLLVLRSPQLDYETSRVAGEILTARKRLAALQAARLGNTPTDSSAVDRYNQLTGEEEELKESLASLEHQAVLLRAERDALKLCSPLSGQVLTWDVEQLLAARPVARGQTLLTVANLAGDWELKLKIEDDEAGFVLGAQRARTSPLPVSFVLAAAPQQVHRGRTQSLALVTDVDEDRRNTVEATVAVDPAAISPLRPGATVRAKFDCGRRALGYVWFHKVWDSVRSWILL